MNTLLEQFSDKCSFASNFSHPNVEQFLRIDRLSGIGIPVIITELLTESLTVHISCTDDILDNDLQLSVCSDMAQGLEYLHSHYIVVHSNLHGNNVLMTHDHHAKIADYLCPLLITDVNADNSLDYAAPETTHHKSITFQSNVFTLAVLFLEVITKHSPQPSGDLSILEVERRRNDLSSVSENHSMLLLIKKCLSNDEAERPLMVDICKHLVKNKVSLIEVNSKSLHKYTQMHTHTCMHTYVCMYVRITTLQI